MNSHPEKRMPVNLEQIKHGPTETGVEELILRRWSPRTFADKPVSGDDLRKIFTAASWAASCSGDEPWRFLVGRKGDDTYAKIFETLVEFNQMWAGRAPVLVLSAGKRTFSPKAGKSSGEPNAYGLHDTGAASANMCLEAIALGLHTHGMAGFDQDKARALFEIPEDFAVGAVWAIGYLGEVEALPEFMQKMETTPRTRRPLDEFVFDGWAKSATL
jgi:nitroreductase